jgi:hypothetical protein
MKIIVDIPYDYYQVTIIEECLISCGCSITELPKGHGRLGDLSEIYVKLNEAQVEGTDEYKGLGEAKQIVCNASTIIEADTPKRRKGTSLEENDSGYNCENWIP